MMFTQNLNPDTQAVMLLCANLHEADCRTTPLSPTEFDWLLKWLVEKNLNVADLVNGAGDKLTGEIEHNKITPDRLRQLLGRGGTLAIAVESITSNGMWILSRLDSNYPHHLNGRLDHIAPPLLYGAGDQNLLSTGGLAIVGSRDIDEPGVEYTRIAAEFCARDNITVISGGARGVDQAAMRSALEEGGNVVGVLAAGLTRAVITGGNREPIMNGNMVLLSPYNPNAGFSVGNAMGRNKYIYAMSDWALIVSSSHEKGGTWSGAMENLKAGWGVPIFVRQDDDIPQGNTVLIKKGGIPLTPDEIRLAVSMRSLLEGKIESEIPEPEGAESDTEVGQLNMFD